MTFDLYNIDQMIDTTTEVGVVHLQVAPEDLAMAGWRETGKYCLLRERERERDGRETREGGRESKSGELETQGKERERGRKRETMSCINFQSRC